MAQGGHVVLVDPPVPASAETWRRFPASPAAVALVRRYVSSTLEGWGCSEVIDDALIAASELAANAVQYGGGDFIVGLSRRSGALRLVVADPNPAPPHLCDRGELAVSGRGLAMIDRLASQWGHERAGDGKLVWVELAT